MTNIIKCCEAQSAAENWLHLPFHLLYIYSYQFNLPQMIPDCRLCIPYMSSLPSFYLFAEEIPRPSSTPTEVMQAQEEQFVIRKKERNGRGSVIFLINLVKQVWRYIIFKKIQGRNISLNLKQFSSSGQPTLVLFFKTSHYFFVCLMFFQQIFL